MIIARIILCASRTVSGPELVTADEDNVEVLEAEIYSLQNPDGAKLVVAVTVELPVVEVVVADCECKL